MRIIVVIALVFAFGAGTAASALAQRLPFERTFDVNGGSVLDVSTVRGEIDINVGEPGRIVVAGTVTIRIGWDVPTNAGDLARRVADNPPVERAGRSIRLRPPSDTAERRAVTVAYDVRVPPDTEVLTVSESGATTVRGVSGPVTVRTQSGAIELERLGGTIAVTTGSGSVNADDVAGALNVITESSAFGGSSLRGSVRVRTGSGTIDIGVVGKGDVDVESGSSAIRVSGIDGGLAASTRSGRVTIEGAPTRPWQVSTRSGSVRMSLTPAGGFDVDASSRSGSVTVDGGTIQGTISKRRIAGAVGGGGPLVRVVSGSGSIGLVLNASR